MKIQRLDPSRDHEIAITIQLTCHDVRATITQLRREKNQLIPITGHWFLYCLGEYLYIKDSSPSFFSGLGEVTRSSECLKTNREV